MKKLEIAAFIFASMVYYNANSVFLSISTLHQPMLKGSADVNDKKHAYAIVGQNIQRAREKAGFSSEYHPSPPAFAQLCRGSTFYYH